jgi:hypothetical protein
LSYLFLVYSQLTQGNVREFCLKMSFAKQRREVNISLKSNHISYTRQAMYIHINLTMMCVCVQCCSGKAMRSLLHILCVCVCVCVCVVLVFQHAGISSLCASVIFFNIIPLTARFVEKLTEHTNCVLRIDFLYNFYLRHFPLKEEFSWILS